MWLPRIAPSVVSELNEHGADSVNLTDLLVG